MDISIDIGIWKIDLNLYPRIPIPMFAGWLSEAWTGKPKPDGKALSKDTWSKAVNAVATNHHHNTVDWPVW